jgi:LuxR family quorum-sensing system transcriptional regulator CciR
MLLIDLLSGFFEVIETIDSQTMLLEALSSICQEAGFSYFAISHHADFATSPPDLIHLHNYPAEFARYHDRYGLGLRDPVHRLSQLRGAGFIWSAMPRLLPQFTSADRDVLERAEEAGLGDGYTKPFHVPGERSGSCSFAVRPGLVFPRQHIPLAEALGSFAFEALRMLNNRQTRERVRKAWLTERERQVVIWVGHGKQVKEIARILDLSPETVNDHLRHARAKFGVHKSSLLIFCALLNGSITYSELLQH